MSRTGILLVTRNLPPLWGGMEQLNWNLAREVRLDRPVHVVGPRGAARLAPEGVSVTEVPLGPLPVFLVLAFFATLWSAVRRRPAIIFAGSGLTAPLAWLVSRMTRAASIVYLHGLDAGTSHAVYRRLWMPVFRRMTRVIANSTATAALARQLGVEAERLAIVHPGVRLGTSPAEEGGAFRARHALDGRPILLSVGRLTRRKGLAEFVADVLPAVVKGCPDVVLVVVGGVPKNSLLAGSQSVEHIQAAADGLGLGRHLLFTGIIEDRDLLSAIYVTSDVHVFPVREIPDDPEGFGMVAVEAAAHGLPTVAYATGGIVDAVRDGVSGRLVPSGDAAAFADAVLALLADRLPPGDVRRFAEGFEWSRFGEKVRSELDRAQGTP